MISKAMIKLRSEFQFQISLQFYKTVEKVEIFDGNGKVEIFDGNGQKL